MSLEISHSKADGSNDSLQIAIRKSYTKMKFSVQFDKQPHIHSLLRLS